MRADSAIMIVGLIMLTFYSPPRMSGQTWTQTSAPLEYWYSIASSADGSKLAAAPDYGYIYNSTNAGQTWNPTGSPSSLWRAMACSADGTNLIAASAPDYGPGAVVFVSHDVGVSWTQAAVPDYFWRSIACSADGSRIFVESGSTPDNSVIYYSTDSGASWAQAPMTNQPWSCVACSADGMRVAATGYSGTWTSTNGGTNWNPTTTPFAGLSVAVSGNGNVLTVLTYGSVAVSGDWGSTWVTNTSTPEWLGIGSPQVASSADGSQLAALGSEGYGVEASFSTNAGLSWSNSAVYGAGVTNPCSIASSADGARLAVALAQFGIFISQRVPTPVLNIASSGDSVLLSWILPSQEFALQQSADLATWSAVGVTPVLNYTNLHNEVTLPRQAGPRFYRLASP